MEQIPSHNPIDNINESLSFEPVDGKENIVKAVSVDTNGTKQEVYLYVMSEEQFEGLMPESQKPLYGL